jgi:hypothetical protein
MCGLVFGLVCGVVLVDVLVCGVYCPRCNREPVPPDLGFNFTSTVSNVSCPVKPGIGPITDNILSALTHTEWLRRLVLHREIPSSHRTPNLQYVGGIDTHPHTQSCPQGPWQLRHASVVVA